MKRLIQTLCIVFIACVGTIPVFGGSMPAHAGSTNWGNRWFEALKLYEEGRFALAAERFSLVAERAEDEFLKRRATLGALLAGLAGADSRTSFDSALDAWRKWTVAQGGGPLPIEAEMLEPIFRRVARCSAGMRDTDEAVREHMESMAGEVERLREQIQALESLYREIKRKEKIIE